MEMPRETITLIGQERSKKDKRDGKGEAERGQTIREKRERKGRTVRHFLRGEKKKQADGGGHHGSKEIPMARYRMTG